MEKEKTRNNGTLKKEKREKERDGEMTQQTFRKVKKPINPVKKLIHSDVISGPDVTSL